MNAGKTCPTCGTVSSDDALGGLCLKCLGRLGFASEAPAPGDSGLLRLGDYELLEEIARGGMGVVYRARQLSLNRVVAVKVVLHGPFSSPEFVRRFRTEAAAAAALRHPNIISIYEIGEHNGHHFLSMEYVEGQNFAQLVREQPLPARQAAAYLKTVAQAIDYAHRQGILHRDLKPSNLLLDAFDQPRITDFGLAKLLHDDSEITLTGQVLGSPNHIPPEQAAGAFSKASPRSDVYSLGAVLYQLLTGRPPFQGETVQEVLLQVQTAEPVPPRRLNPSVPLDLQTICLKCLQKRPVDRYDSAQVLADDLGRFLAREPIQARPVPLRERVWLWWKRRPLLAAAAAALAVTALLGLTGILWQWRRAASLAQEEIKLRLATEDSAAKTRLNLYAADVDLAAQAIASDDFGVARRRLAALRPGNGEPDLRGFEWRYLWNLCRGSELATMSGHEWIVTCAAFSPDGKQLATGSMDGTARIWDWARQQITTTLRIGTNEVTSVAFTPDARELMVACGKGVEMWSTDSWRIHTNFPARLASLARNGTLLATADSSPFYYEPAGLVTLWDWRTGQKLRRFQNPGRCLALSPDGRRLAVARPGTGIEVFDTYSGDLLRLLPTANPVWALNFSPDGAQLLSAGWSSDVSLWHWNEDAPPRTLSGHHLTVWSAVFSPDGQVIATTGSDQTIRLWDARSLNPLRTLRGHDSEVWCAAFAPDGQRLATGGKDCNVMLWSTTAASQQDFLPHAGGLAPIFSPDGTKIITVKPDGPEVSQLWNTADRRLLTPAFEGGSVASGFSPDGKFVLFFDAAGPALEFRTLEGADPGHRVALEVGSAGKPRFILWGMSPEQAFFFAADSTGVIRVWQVESGRLVRIIQGPPPPLRNLVAGPGARHLAASVERDNFARLYLCAGAKESLLAGHRDFVSGLAFSPDDTLLATGSMDGTIRLWNTLSGQCTATLPGHIEETTDVAFSPDGRTLASLGHKESLKLWHLPTLREVFSENLPQAGIWLRFSPDGRWLAVATEEQRLRLLEAPQD